MEDLKIKQLKLLAKLGEKSNSLEELQFGVETRLDIKEGEKLKCEIANIQEALSRNESMMNSLQFINPDSTSKQSTLSSNMESHRYPFPQNLPLFKTRYLLR